MVSLFEICANCLPFTMPAYLMICLVQDTVWLWSMEDTLFLINAPEEPAKKHGAYSFTRNV